MLHRLIVWLVAPPVLIAVIAIGTLARLRLSPVGTHRHTLLHASLPEELRTYTVDDIVK